MRTKIQSLAVCNSCTIYEGKPVQMCNEFRILSELPTQLRLFFGIPIVESSTSDCNLYQESFSNLLPRSTTTVH